MTSNVRHLPHPTNTDSPLEILQAMDTLLADIALDNPDLEPGFHAAIRNVRQRYRAWLGLRRHPSGGDTA